VPPERPLNYECLRRFSLYDALSDADDEDDGSDDDNDSDNPDVIECDPYYDDSDDQKDDPKDPNFELREGDEEEEEDDELSVVDSVIFLIPKKLF
jgi:hypothetical protein